MSLVGSQQNTLSGTTTNETLEGGTSPALGGLQLEAADLKLTTLGNQPASSAALTLLPGCLFSGRTLQSCKNRTSPRAL